jgi:hypothetical protein
MYALRSLILLLVFVLLAGGLAAAVPSPQGDASMNNDKGRVQKDATGTVTIKGVPNLGWVKERECTFIGALEAVLEATDHPYFYADLMGYTALAFRTRWFCGNKDTRWCPSSPVGEMEEEIAAAQKATGWPLRVAFVDPNNAQTMAALTQQFVASIDAGRPVLAYEPRLNMDVVFGYKDNGKILLLRDYFTPEKPLEIAPEKLGFLVIFLGNHTNPTPSRAAIIAGLQAAVVNWRRDKFAEGPGAYWYGESALTHWTNDLGEFATLKPAEKESLRSVSFWNMCSLIDARQAAVKFLRGNARLFDGETKAAMLRAADIYEKEVALLLPALKNGDTFSGAVDKWTPEVGKQEQALLGEAKKLEAEAMAEIEKAVKAQR